jgi:hypothetical protein
LSNLAVSDVKASTTNASSTQIWWLALTLTPVLGPTRAKRLVEFFGSIDKVFEASLTELEAAGLPATPPSRSALDVLSNWPTMKLPRRPAMACS